jgi:hypothetical protein
MVSLFITVHEFPIADYEWQAWDLSPGHSLFSGQDPERKSYLTRVHLAEVIGLLKPPPADLIKRGKRSLE